MKTSVMKHFVPLCLAAFLGCLMATKAETVKVDSAQKLIEVFEASSGGVVEKDIVLLGDLDFSDSGLTRPLGVDSNGNCVAYSGKFQGNGNSIKGLVMSNENSEGYKNAGLFCSLKNAVFDGLVIDESCSFKGTVAGGLSVSVNGSLTVTNTKNEAAVSGVDNVGGFIGIVEFNNIEIAFENCVSDGNVTGNKQIGGFIGYIYQSFNMTMSFSNCVNNGNITGNKDYVAGFVGFVSTNNNMTLNVDNCANNGKITGINYVGGFCGSMNGNTDVSVTITDCVNNGMVSGNDYVGGFIGYISSINTLSVSKCTNNGNVAGDAFVGAFLGRFHRSSHLLVTVSHFINNGNITGGYLGMIVGYMDDLENFTMTISHSINHGVFSYCDYVGGFIGRIYGNKKMNVELINCTNDNNIVGRASVYSLGYGGLIGYIRENEDINITISKCFNHANTVLPKINSRGSHK